MSTLIRTFHHPVHVVTVRHVEEAVLAVAVGAELAAWWHQHTAGLVVTGMSDTVPWGIYTAAYAMFAGLAAGSLGLAGLVLLGGRASLAPLAGRAAVAGLAGSVAALLAFLVNLARPQLAYHLVLHPNWRAPLVWDVYALVAAAVVAMALLAALRRQVAGARRAHTTSHVLAALALAPAVAVPVLTAWVFTFPVGRPGLNDALLVPMLLLAAAFSAVALAGLRGAVAAPARSALARWLVTGLVALLALLAIDYVTALNGTAARAAAAEVLLPGGDWAWLTWMQWSAAILALVLLLVPAVRRSRPALPAASGLALVTAAATYLTVVPVGFVTPPIALPPGVAAGAVDATVGSFQRLGSYTPTLTEYGVVLGVLAIFLTVVLLLSGTGRRGGAP